MTVITRRIVFLFLLWPLAAWPAGCAGRVSPAASAPSQSGPMVAGATGGFPQASEDGSITEASIRSHVTFLASDALNGRGSGTRDEWIAAEYIGAQMLRWGLEPLGDHGGFVQRIEVQRYETVAAPVMSASGTTYRHQKEIFVQALGRAGVSGPLHKYASGTAVPPGSVVMMPETPPAGFQSLVTSAAAVLLMETPQVRRRWSSRFLPAPAASILGLPSATSVRPAVVYLDKQAHASMSALAPGTPVSIQAEVKPAERTPTWNAVGRITGSDPGGASEVILLSAHLDHEGNRSERDGAAGADTIYNGADDDASGCAAVLELAQALARGPRLRRTIVFAFFGSEEGGGFGSAYFADRPVVPLTQIVANLQFEMIGRPDSKVPPETLWLTGYERSTLGPELARLGAKLVQDPHPEENFFARSDNIQFARRGVVAHTISSFGLHKEYHQPSDEARHINFAHMTQAIRSLVAPIRSLANSTFRPEWLPGQKP